jgi:putative colanic acid biosynthesis UDP-glucose lipid carrier transferase
LDELPQFFNVLGGSMSLVGPRPHAVQHDHIFRLIVDDYGGRLRVKPGITGWAQIHGLRGPTPTKEVMEQRLKLDRFYIENWSLALDFRILLATLVVPFHAEAF